MLLVLFLWKTLIFKGTSLRGLIKKKKEKISQRVYAISVWLQGWQLGSVISNTDFRAASWQEMLRFHVGGAPLPMNRTVYTKRKTSLKQQEPTTNPKAPLLTTTIRQMAQLDFPEREAIP